jgi:hypothetical protein
MKRIFAAMALCGCLACGSAGAQTSPVRSPAQGRVPVTPPPSIPPARDAAPNAGPARGGARTYAANALPEPLKEDEIKPMAMELPDDPLEPYLLTKANGPFMVLAQVFRGPEAEKMALALCKELRQEYNLPAYILRSKEFPMKSYIRGVPVQAPSETMKAAIKQPEQVRIHDEAAVLVGDEKTEQATEELLHKIKKIHPKCLDAMPQLFPWRRVGLNRAIRTTNPYVPAHWLYPKTPDRLIVQMNSGLHSIANCPGHYTIQVAQFSGHSAYDLYGQGMAAFDGLLNPKKSPLQTAHDDAEKLAEQLSRSAKFHQLGTPVFVYHNRTSSRVYVGSFSSTDDPNALAVREELLKIAGEMNVSTKDRWGRPQTDRMIVPATMLTSVDDLKGTMGK